MTASPPVPPSPSPSLSDADDAIRAILEQAKILHASLTPLYTWSTLCRIIQSCDLAVLSRQPEFERLYAEEFGPLVRRTYGGMEVYLRKQLGWGQPEGGKGQGEGEKDREYWTREGRTNVRRNDWPYGIPTDVTHWVVWVPLPLFHPALCTPSSTRPSTPLPPSSYSSALLPPSSARDGTSTPSGTTTRNPFAGAGAGGKLVAPTKGTWDYVSRNGLGGLTGGARERWEREESAGGTGEGEREGEGEEESPGREIDAFVRGRWRVEEGWETAWFANPPGLQSVPGLAHFHVLARKTTGDEEIGGPSQAEVEEGG